MPFPKLESFIFENLHATGLPAVSAAIVKDGELIWARGFGSRSLEEGLPATPETLYGIASVTKSFTCIGIMQLVEQGKLSVDDPVEKYIPAFQVKPGGELVRLRHLMSHTSGIPALAYIEQILTAHHGNGSDGTALPIYTAADLLDFMNEAEGWALHKPGEEWYYLNEGFALLGEVISRVSGTPYKQYIRENILLPLGMTRSTFDKAPWEADADTATPYTIAQNGNRIPQTYTWGQIAADGGLISSALEMATYIMMHLNGGAYNGQRILSAESLREMQTVRINPPGEGNPFGADGYGYGLHIRPDFLGHELIGHGGSLGVMTCNMKYIPAENLGIMVMGNGGGYAKEQFALYGLAEALGHDPDELYFVQHDRRMDQLTGVYESYKATMRVIVSRRGDLLVAEERTKHGTDTTTLIPDELGAVKRTFYSLANGIKSPTTFQVKSDSGVDMVLGRYLFRKVGAL